jgi:hypothetical protein
MRWRSRSLILLATASVVGALASTARSADHRDAPATTADPASDINDVYAFVDGGNMVLAMTVTPFAGAGAKFATTTQYIFHVASGAAFGKTTSNVNVICTFDAAQKVSCWVGTADYVTGDASNRAAPLKSASGKVQVFAGAAADPFFFNLQGFKDAVAAVEQAAGGLTFDTSGCPAVNAATSTALLGLLSEKTSANNAQKTAADDFATANTLALVVSVDKSLLNKGGPIASVWASTNKGQ